MSLYLYFFEDVVEAYEPVHKGSIPRDMILQTQHTYSKSRSVDTEVLNAILKEL